MSDCIYIDGVRYLTAHEASEHVSLTRDYVARLCKEGKVLGKRIGKQWYVNQDSLGSFVLAQQYAHAKRREELAGILNHAYSATRSGGTASTMYPGAPQAEHREAHRTFAQNALKTAMARAPIYWNARATNMLVSAPAHVASLRAHSSTLPYTLEFLHKLIAVAVAVLFTIGTYAFVDAQYARVVEHLTLDPSTTRSVRGQFAAVAADPMHELPGVFTKLARSINGYVDTLVYGIMFSSDPARSSQQEVVTARVVPFGSPARPVVADGSTASPAPPSGGTPAGAGLQTGTERSSVERIIETQYVVSASGGITEELLNQRLNELNKKLSSQMYAISAQGSSNSTQIAQNYNAFAQSQSIDQLSRVTITNPTISGGSISGISIGGSSITGDISIAKATTTSLAVTGSATSTFGNGINLSAGCFAVDGTCLSASGASLSAANTWTALQLFSAGASTTQLSVFQKAYFGGSATSTFDSAGALSLAGVTNSLLWVNGSGTVSATTTPTASYFIATSTGVASQFPYASSTALTVSGTASTSAFFANGLTTCQSGNVLTWSGGTFGCAADAQGSGSWPFTVGTNFGQADQATSTLLSLKGAPFSLVASSTVNFVNASTTNLTVFSTGNTWFQGITSALLSTDSTGKVVSTTTIGANLITGLPTGANPTGTIGLSAVNGTASTFLRSDTAPALSQAIAPTWTALHVFSAGASTTQLSALDALYIGRTATTTIRGDGLYSTIPYASSTAITVSGAASTSAFFANGLTTCNSGNVLTWSGGTFGCAADSTGGGGSDPFTHVSYAGLTTSATTSAFRTTSLLAASTTDFTYASTTQLTTSGNTYLTSLTSALLGTDSTGKVVATTTIGINLLTANTISGVSLGSSLAALTATNGTLTFSGSYDGSTARTVGLNLASANTWTALQTINFASSTSLAVSGTGFFGTASSTNTINQYASSSVLTVDRNAYFPYLTSALLGTDSTGKLVSTTTVGNTLLTNAGALTVTAGSGLTGGGSVALGGTVTLTRPWDWSLLSTFGTSTNATTTPTWFLTGLFASSTSQFAYASTTALTVSGTASTSAFFANGLTTCQNGNVLTWSGGTFGCAADSTGGGGSDPFTHVSYAGLTTSATTSAFRTTSLLAASTTDFTYASTTQLTNSGNTYLTGLTSKLLATDSTGLVVGTTTIGNSLLTSGGAFTINSDGFLTGGGTLSLGGTLTLNASTSPTVGYLFATSTRASSLLYASSTALTATSLFGTNALLTGSTTIGGGSTTTGLTILGGATTTGTLIVQGTATSTFSSGLSATYLNITGTIATSTFARGVDLAGGCFSINGTCVGGGSGVSGGAANKVAFFTDATTLSNNTLFHFNNTNTLLGIGTTTPYWSLTIASSTGPQLALADTTAGSNAWTLRSIANSLYIATSTPTATSTTAALAFNGTTAAATFGSLSTTTFSGGIQGTYLNLTGSTASSTLANGLNIATGCFSVNGTCLTSAASNSGVVLSAIRTYTSTTQWSKPSNLSYAVVEIWGGGGGGGNGSSGLSSRGGAGGGAGGAGGYTMKIYTASALSGTSSVQVVVGAAGGTSVFANNTTLAATSTGGSSGSNASNDAGGAGGAGGVGSGGDVNLTGATGQGGSGGAAITADTVSGGGGAGGKGPTAPRGGSGGGGGFGAGINRTGGTGSAGQVPGGAGGGGGGAGSNSESAGSSGAGASGAIIVYEYTTTGLTVGSVNSGTAGQLPFYAAAGQDLTATSTLFLTTSGNFGIGTTSPQAKLEITNTLSGATADQLYLSNLASATSTASRLTFRTDDLVHNTGTSTAAITSILQQNFNAGKGDLAFSVLNSGALTEAARIASTGYFGVGTTSPFRKFAVVDSANSAPQIVLTGSGGEAQFFVNSTGDLNIGAAGADTYFNNDNLWVCTGGSITTGGCPSGSPSGQGNLVVENKFGIGTSTLGVSGANYSFTLDLQNDSTTNLLSVSTSTSGYGTTKSIFKIDNRGYVGVGTSTPTSLFSVGGLISVGASSTGQLATLGTATSTFNGDIKIVGKLDVSTIDPVYTIDGVKYATYGASTIGIREETLATIRLDTKGANGKYVYAIPFSTLSKGSDLWLFYQVTDFGKNWSNLVVSLTPSFDGAVFYKKDIATNTLLVYADQPGEVSLRLSAYRYDFTKWGNLRTDQNDASYLGHVLDSKP